MADPGLSLTGGDARAGVFARIRPNPIPVRALLALGLAVLIAHAVLMRNLPLGLDLQPPSQTRIFTTRSIETGKPAPVVRLPNRPVSKTPLPPKPKPKPKPKPAQPRADSVMRSANRLPPPVLPAPRAQAPVPQADEPPPLELPTEFALPADPVSEPPVEATAQAPEPLAPEPARAPEAIPGPSADDATGVPAQPTTVTSATAGASAPAVAVAPPSSVPARPYVIPGSVRLRFDAFGKKGRLEYRAMGSLIWLHDGVDYEARMEMGDWIIGTRVITSVGKLTTDGLAPRRFSDKFRSERAAHFDRRQNRVVFSANTPSARLFPGAQDQVSIFVQLASLVAADPLAFPVDSTLTIQTIGPRDAEPWVFTVEREEMVKLPSGDLPALKLVRKPGKDYAQKVELWLAPDLAFLPARIRITFANGDFIDQKWRSTAPP